MNMPDLPPVPRDDRNTPRQPRRPRRRVWKVLAWLVGILLVLLIALVATAVAALRTEAGTRHLWNVATRLSAGMLAGQLDGGTVASGLRLHDVVFASGDTRIAIDQIDAKWDLSWRPARLHVAWLKLGKIDARLPASAPSTEPAKMPQSLELPLAVDVDTLTVGELSLLQGPAATSSPLVLSDLSGALHSDGQRHRVLVDKLVTPYGKLQANAQIGGKAPFPLSAEALLEGRWKEETYAVSATANGSLEQLRAELEANGDRIRARGNADLTPFGKVPFTHLMIDGERINPRLFSPTAPQANLSVHAELRPVESVPPPPEVARPKPGESTASAVAAASAASASAPVPTPAAPTKNPLAVAGEVTVRNLEPGPIDKERLPVHRVQARVELSELTQTLRDLRITLPGRAEIVGQGTLREGRGGFDLDVRHLDAAALHTGMVATNLSGPVILRLEPGRQSVALDVAGGEIKLFADARIDEDAVTLATLRAGLGSGTLTAEGKLGLKDQQPFDFKGKLANFDPARLAKVAPGRINAEFSTRGSLEKVLRVALDFALGESEYAGLPMTGNGKVRVEGERLLPSQASLLMAGNQVNLNGSFGARGDSLKVNIDAPQLDRLKFGVGGRAKVDAVVTGTLKKPEVVGDYSAQSLVVGPHKVASANGHVELRGGLDGTLSAQLAARDYQGPQATVRTLDANLSGTQANHTFDAKAAGTMHERPLQLALSGQGAWRGAQGWTGTIRTLEERGTANVRLVSPTQLMVADRHIRLGQARLQFERATMNIEGFEFDHGRIRTQGNFNGVEVGNILKLMEAFSGESQPVRSDLVLDASWNLNLAETATGFAEVRRRSGDASVNAGRGWTTLGLGETALRADFSGNRVTLRGGTTSQRIGKVAVDASAGLVSEQGLLTVGPGSTLGGTITADVPRLKSLEALSGPQYALEGKLAAALRLAGTVGNPLLTGAIDGSGIGITLYDLGIRLTDGEVHVVLDQNTVELKQVRFRGGDGTLTATGAVKLGETDPNITGRIVADKLQLFASPERTLIVSGEAGIANENRQVAIRGKFRVDRGLFDLPKASAPVLGDDVVVVRRKDERELKTAATPVVPEAKPASRFSPVIDVTIDLGDNFRFRGAGADILLAGQLGIKSEPLSPMRATGTVRVVDGTYEAFGRKLDIDRGTINFNGPVDNPNMFIRAMRRNQEVEAGVEVTGTVRLPRVRLVSEPNVPDEDKLSWLMFGYGAESAGSSQQRQLSGSAIGGAALGMIGGKAGKSVVSHFGIDEFSIGPSTAGLNDQQVVSIGKAVSDQISVGYEQSLTSASNVVKLTWAFSRRWSLIAKGGSINGLSVLFNRRFNNWSTLFAGDSGRRRGASADASVEGASAPAGDPVEAIKR
ncbi:MULTISPECIES: translocation/assembly module TamB domain-containing protein [unclassified Cupriavidus]|uniref:translocation/assembly module TamB domain-containing protein n=1 Tax=unclassified Cupriavidus TaxID=2640874 RepID=UPI001C002822|nr:MULTISPECIES: translocation/assembly module TamB domain-containing protein [unclassified Cupriavidus]MCA3187459.1 translocation/assembly module TamB [Cupriavidus sp.]MCA3192878.1 translocation/assembly module TamB [Cupriavidus sp.]MCA3195079.1 translocation/assembly module TamB [Cupriavidus sp.]MCA3204049.1 translocation/assembly module TamB [Cupriavidus sp.]MCA3208711.1 translocation/assembly module TamB [Cupriavidus sp.]